MRTSTAFGPGALPRNLQAALRDIDSPKLHVRRSAARDLGAHIDSPARARVIQRLTEAAMSDTDTETRVQAVLALADGNATEAVESLVSMVETAVPRVQQMLLLALAELAEAGNTRAFDIALHASESPLPALRYQALVALRHVGGVAAVPHLTAALNDSDEEVRWVAVRLVDELALDGEEPDEPAGPAPWVAAAKARLRAVLRDASHRVVVAARILLARWGEAESIESLADLLAPGAPRLELQDELAIVWLVARHGVAPAKPALAKRAWPLLFETPVTFEARVALAAMGDARARQAILRDLHSANIVKCARAIDPVGRLRLSDGRERLVQLLKTPGNLDAATIRLALSRLDS